MKKIISFGVFLFLNTIAFGQIKTLNVSTQGALKNLLTVSESKTITTLTITGNIDARDFMFMRDKMTALSILDLTLVTIKAYIGTDGTIAGVNTSYSANEIPPFAFYDPSMLTYKTTLASIKFPAYVTKIGEKAFYYCSNLANTIIIPATLTKISDYAFYGCTAISSFSVVSSNTRYSSNNGVLFNKSQDTLFIFPPSKGSSYTIPSTVKHIGNSAFDNCLKVSSISIPSSVTSIGSYAFSYCSGITGDLILPSSLKKLGEGAFYGCWNLTGTINIPSTLVDLGNYCFLESNNVMAINVATSNPVYSSDNGLLFSKNVDTLFVCPPAKSATINIPSTVKLIGSHAFYNCSKLTGTLNIPQIVDYIGYYAFYGCTGLSSFSVDSNNSFFTSEDGVLLSKNKDRLIACPVFKTGQYQMPSSIKEIDPSAFAFCQISGILNLPANVSYIGDYTFYNCTQITNIEVNPANTRYSSDNGVLLNHNQDTLLVCPFAKIGYYNVPTTVKHIGYSAFDGCAGINSITLPSSLISIGNYAFDYCTGLTKILIPQSTINIANGAFYGCSNLIELKIANPVPPIVDYYTLNLINKSICQLIVPTGSKTTYQNAPYWAEFLSISESDSFSKVFVNKGNQYVYSQKSGIIADGLNYGEQIEIYSIDGRKIISEKAKQQKSFWKLPEHSIYLVRISNKVYKVIL